MSDTQKPDNAEDRKAAVAWGKDQLSDSIDDLSDAKIIDGPAVEARIVWMVPMEMFIAELRESVSHPPAIWVIGGNVATDHVDVRLAESPRDAARHFALKWQMTAARDGDDARAIQAERLYALVEVDEAWV